MNKVYRATTIGCVLTLACLWAGNAVFGASSSSRIRSAKGKTLSIEEKREQFYRAFNKKRGAFNAPYISRVPGANTTACRGVTIPTPGYGPSNNLTQTRYIENPVEIYPVYHPIEVVCGTGEEKMFRGKPLLYGYDRDGLNSPESDTLIPETVLRTRDSRGNITSGNGGGADGSPVAVTNDPSVAKVNAIAFGEGALTPDEKKKFVSKVDSRSVLETAAFHRHMADRYRNERRWVDAADEFSRVVKICPNDVVAQAYHAEANWMAGRRNLAEKEFSGLRHVNNAEVQFLCGNWLRESNRNDEAISAYKRAIESSDKTIKVKALNNLGVAYMNAHDYDSAKETFDKVLALDPDFENTLLNAGVLYDDIYNDAPTAISYYERYLAVPGALRKGEVQRWTTLAKKKIEQKD